MEDPEITPTPDWGRSPLQPPWAAQPARRTSPATDHICSPVCGYNHRLQSSLIMGWSSPDSWATRLFSGDPVVILVALLVSLLFPVLLHLFFYTQTARAKVVPTFLVLGPSGAGKTSLLSLVSLSPVCPALPVD